MASSSKVIGYIGGRNTTDWYLSERVGDGEGEEAGPDARAQREERQRPAATAESNKMM